MIPGVWSAGSSVFALRAEVTSGRPMAGPVGRTPWNDGVNMQWTDEGIVIGVRRHGEASAILELMTREHGRHLGLVRGGFGSRMKPVLQTGNGVSATWRARLDEHLGNYTIEPVDLRAANYFADSHSIYGVSHLAALMRLLPERDPHAGLYDEFDGILERLADS